MIEVLDTMGVPMFLAGCVALGLSVPLKGVGRFVLAALGAFVLASIQVVANA